MDSWTGGFTLLSHRAVGSRPGGIPPSLRTARVFAPMATETMSAAPKRRAFVLKARARPALASLTAGAGFTRADLAASPMPAIGDVAAEKSKLSFGDIMKKASQRAFRGGAAGFAAGVVQVRDRRASRRATPPPPSRRLRTPF